jgi:hypothetical protein
MPRPGLMSYAIITRLLTMTIIWLLMLVWVLNAYRAECLVVAAMLLPFCAVIFIAGNEHSQLMRRALYGETTRSKGWLFRLVYNRVLITGRDLIVALALGVVLLATALTFTHRHWSVLFADLLLLTLLLPRIQRALNKEIRPVYRYAMSRQQALWVSTLLLWAQIAILQIYFPPSEYIGMRWQEVVTYNLSMPEVGCGALEAVARVVVTGQAIATWSVQNSARVARDPTQFAMLWVGYSTLIGFSFLIALAYSRALIGVMSRPWEMWQTGRHADATPAETGDARDA